jgi:hypothetical protein
LVDYHAVSRFALPHFLPDALYPAAEFVAQNLRMLSKGDRPASLVPVEIGQAVKNVQVGTTDSYRSDSYQNLVLFWDWFP